MTVSNPLEFLNYGFGVKAIIASALSGFLCASIGTYIVLRKMAFIGAGLAHIAFAGISFGLMIGSLPIAWGIVFSLISSTAIWYINYRSRIHYDIAIGILFSTSMGLAILFLGISGKYKSAALSYLFGSPLTVGNTDIALLITLTIIAIAFYIAFWKEIYLTTFSEEIAKAAGYKTQMITFLAITITTLSVVLAMKAVGAILVFSLLVIPPSTAYMISRSFLGMFYSSTVFGVASAIVGTILSFSLNIPSGACITIVSFANFAITYIISKEVM